MKRSLLFLLSIFTLLGGFLPTSFVFAQENAIFEAKVIEVVSEKVVTEGDVTVTQQELKLIGQEDKYDQMEFTVSGIEDYLVVDQPVYNQGDKVLAYESVDGEGNKIYYIVDFVRTGPLFWLSILFIGLVLVIGKKQGFRALIVLGLTFLVILQFMIPRLMNGDDPVVISVLGGLIILFLAIFGTEGFNKKSRVSFLAIACSLFMILIFSLLFTSFAHLTGYNEHILFLSSLVPGLNMQGLLLAGIIIGSLGVLDDIIVSQVSIVNELADTDKELSRAQIYKKAMRVGTDHINAIINTLFLAYAGAALPLLILFSVKQEPFLTLTQVLNNEIIATEIVRTLVGSMSLILAMPLATWLATRAFISKDVKGKPDFDINAEMSHGHHHHHH